MFFKSTRSEEPLLSLRSAVLNCFPEDGGLYIPAKMQDIRQFFLYMDGTMGYSELVSTISLALFENELNPILAEKIAQAAYSFEPKLIPLSKELSLLELYNGPTGIFKDFGLSYCASLIEAFVGKEGRAVTLNATRGRSGASIARAFYKKKNVLAVLLYPKGTVRGLDPETFVENGGNILPIQVEGSFDKCQKLVQAAFKEKAFVERYSLTSANSVNVGRLIPQAFYYLYAFVMLKKELHADLVFSVPSGNFGNLLAGLYAWKFGLPVNAFLAAMNENNSMGDFLAGGPFVPRPIKKTFSSAMDVGNPANYERLSAFYTEAPAVMKNMVVPYKIDDNETKRCIVDAYNEYGLMLDPHSAVGLAAAKRHAKQDLEDGHIVVLGTGHPGRSAKKLEDLLGVAPELPENLEGYEKKVEPVAKIGPQLEALEALIALASPS